ncbi:metallophosphoesterase [Alsobacter metallidurans]|uniref:Metallophosphoesterase n=1 Tax=Alsobacter metallidurans TaxID=340221 RepID=A0A917IAJ9_9HYPH|nr:metallophosphoesterase [Alsobacter metallidurans]GGH28794.1 metallophosphoesterase [Alsobacter metallidurans]
MFRLAHLSDPHLGPIPKPRLRELAGKRMTGYMNWRRGRDRIHDMGVMERLIADMKSFEPDHIACTGDLINIGLHGEFQVAREFLEDLGAPDKVSFVPGNHDAYVRTTLRDIERFLSPWMTSDNGKFEGFPYVRLVGPIAIVGLSSAVPTGPFVASGTLGREQREKVANVLAFLAQQPLARVVLIHHPPHRSGSLTGRGLTDASALEEILGQTGADLILHGHNHVTSVNRIAGPGGKPIPVVGVPSCSAIRGALTHRAGYHLFDIDLTESGPTITGRTRGLTSAGEIVDLGELPL